MRRRLRFTLGLATVALVFSLLPGGPQPVRAAEYTLESQATYDVEPAEGRIEVSIGLTFTNTTPDPAGQFSVFSELKLAVHDAAQDVVASDEEGELEVSVAVEDDVNVATVELRDDLRYEEAVALDVGYTLPDGEDPRLRVRPSVVVFPAWSFGTSGEVSVTIPTGYELRVDGDTLSEEGGRLVSGPIENPGEWLALVTAVRPAEYIQSEATVPLNGGTADLVVRAFADDEAWADRTLTLVTEALPLLEEEIGLPYPRIGQLILTETVAVDTTGFAEAGAGGNEILVAFDQPSFTVLHQVAHVWLAPSLIESRWIREGLASHVAQAAAGAVEAEPPYDPAAEAQERAADALPLDTWGASGPTETEAYGYAASWAFIDELEEVAGREALHGVLARVAASIGPYESAEIEPEPPAEGGGTPATPLTTRAFLDHLETLSDADLAPLFAERVLTEADRALLEPRAEARAAFDRLVAAADSWGAPDPVRGAMNAWSFDDATAQIAVAADWLDERDALLAELKRHGLAAPERLKQAYRAYGGGPEAVNELEAERVVVEEYAEAAGEVHAERSLLARIGLVGGPDPDAQLTQAAGRFAEGDLRGAVESIAEARRLVAAADTGGIVRLVSAALLVLVLAGVAVVLFRRRATYTRLA